MVTEDALAALSRAWSHARIKAYQPLARACQTEDEASLRMLAFATDSKQALARLHQHSEEVGRSFAQHLGEPLTLVTLAMVLNRLGEACFEGTYVVSPEERAIFLRRAPACHASAVSPCSASKAAVTGLVVGLTGRATVARPKSLPNGDGHCLDVIQLAPLAPISMEPVPPKVEAEAPTLLARLQALQPEASVHFLGLSNGRVRFELKTPYPASRPILSDVVRSHVKQRCQLEVAEHW